MDVAMEDHHQIPAAMGSGLPPIASSGRQREQGSGFADSWPLHGLSILHDVPTSQTVTRNPVVSDR